MSYPERPLGEILTPVSDFVKVEAGKAYDTIGIYSYGRGIIRRSTIDGTETSYASFNRIHSGQFIYSKLFGWEGALAVVRPEHEGLYASTEFPTFQPDEGQVDFNYLAHLVTWPELHSALRGNTTGMGSRRQRVNVAQLLNTRVPLPDLREQCRIAAKLDAAVAAISNASSLQARRRMLISRLRDALFGQVSNNVELSEAIALDIDPVPIDFDGQYQISGVYGFGRGLFARESINGAQTKYSLLHRLHKDTLVMSKLKAFEGAISIVPEEFDGWYLSPEFPTFRVVEGRILPGYLRLLCTWPQFWSRLSAKSKGVGARRERVSAAQLLGTKVPLPTIDEQRRIISILSKVITADYIRARDEDPQLTTLRRALLNAAFTGKL
ncbi:restriction endonuclease subunit S [Nocardia beijingensis]